VTTPVLSGLTAFPLTPLHGDAVDEGAFTGLVEHLVAAGVDGLGVLGSTGVYAYLDRAERRRVTELAVAAAGGTPVVVGIGALRTRDVLACARDAQDAGAAGLLLAPVSYHPLREEEVLGLYADVAAVATVPVVVYDNPGTTHVDLTVDLHARLAALPGVRAVKIPPVPPDPTAAAARVGELRAVLPPGHGISVSGDPAAALGLTVGCDGWCSMVAGVLPEPARELVEAARSGDADRLRAADDRLAPVWDLYRRFGSLRTVASIAVQLGLVEDPVLPAPLRSLSPAGHAAVAEALTRGGLR
jgi:4-hydroxy-tetrahydrodipicolinate synthase